MPKQFFSNYHSDPKWVTYFKSCTYITFAQYLYIVTLKRHKFLETDNVCDQIAEAVWKDLTQTGKSDWVEFKCMRAYSEFKAKQVAQTNLMRWLMKEE